MQRIAIMEYLMDNPIHPSADDIYTALSPSMPTLSKTTVYNTLKLFSEQGAALMLTIDEKNTNFDADTSVHSHFLCKRCGHIYDLKCPEAIKKVENIDFLKDFGLEAYPVVMSRRSSGMLPYNFPSLQKLNTFFVAIHDINKQKYVFLDSSMDVPAFNILPLELSVNKARMLSLKEKEEKKWVNVMALSHNKSFMKIDARIEGNQVKGHRSTVLYGQEAIEYQANENHKQDNLVSNPENKVSQKEKLTVTNLKVKKQENDWALIEEEFDFVLQADRTDDHLYINPMLFPQLKSNPFIQTERVLPIEFPYPYKFTMLSTLTLPEGYEVEELPQSQSIRSEGDGLQCKYMIQQQGNTILLNYVFHLKGYIFLSEQYKQLQELWAKVIEKNNALIVLKKI